MAVVSHHLPTQLCCYPLGFILHIALIQLGVFGVCNHREFTRVVTGWTDGVVPLAGNDAGIFKFNLGGKTRERSGLITQESSECKRGGVFCSVILRDVFKAQTEISRGLTCSNGVSKRVSQCRSGAGKRQGSI